MPPRKARGQEAPWRNLLAAAFFVCKCICVRVQDLWDIKQSAYVFAGHRGPFGQLALNIIRGALKAVITLLLGEEARKAVPPPHRTRRFFFSFFFLRALCLARPLRCRLYWG